jgi:hypothetical protein
MCMCRSANDSRLVFKCYLLLMLDDVSLNAESNHD